MTVKMMLNEELNGVELYFDSKPSQDILDTLKASGYRWSNYKKCWYAKQNSNTLALAEQLTSGDQTIINQDTNTQAKTITKTEPYFPPYTHVNGKEIFKTSDKTLNGNTSGYFADINAYVHAYSNSVVLIDLTNALKTGKTCKRYSLQLSGYDSQKSVITELWNVGKIETVKNLYDALTTDSLKIDTITIYTGEEKSINTFSPFVEIKPIKTPSKWTMGHVWKAILAGQIFKGVKDGRYTDDYAYDAACNFGTGSRLHLISLAEKLIEHPSGWWVSVDKEENGITQLSVNCHTFDCNTLYYDANCNLHKAEQRRKQDQEELENYNNGLLSEVIPIAPEEIEENTLYTITYLEMDNNTKKYSKKQELLTGSELFWHDEVYIGEDTEPTIEYKIRYKVTSIEEYPIVNNKLYAVSNFYNRPHFEDDNRYINMGNWEILITGKALKEVLTQGNIFPIIKESQYNFDQAMTYIQNHITGKMQWCSTVCDTDYKESFRRIMKEMNRLNINSAVI